MSSRRLAVIPARSGSKRLPGKNTLPLRGKPLLAWTVHAALESGVFDTVLVSTDSEPIAELARALGAQVPFLRPAALADDHTPTAAVTQDALARLEADGPAFAQVAQLLPTCPLRTAADVRASLEQFDASGAPSQVSVSGYGWLKPWWALRRAPDGTMDWLHDPKDVVVRSQDLPELYCPNGAIWWIQAESLRREATFYGPGWTGFELPWTRAADVDEPDDWAMIELLLGPPR